MNKEYEHIKKYLLENKFDKKWFEETFPNVNIPDIITYNDDETIIFTDGYLFSVSFDEEQHGICYGFPQFYELENNEKFIKITGNDIYQAIDFIDNQVYEIYE